jgi:hypothetical protein
MRPLRAAAIAIFRRESDGIDAARHQGAVAAGDPLQQVAQVDVGREEDLRHPVKASTCQERGVFDLLFRSRHFASGKHAQQPGRTLGSIFVEIGVPGSDQRNPEIPCQPRAQNARLARPGDVDNVRAEFTKSAVDEALVTQEGGIEGQILFQAERDCAAAGNIQRGQLALALLAYRASLLPGCKTKKREISPLRKGFKVPAGVGHPVDLVKCIGKEGHSRGRPSA